MSRYKMFFYTTESKLEWINNDYASDADAIAKAKSVLKPGETVKVYAEVAGQLEGRTVWDSEAEAQAIESPRPSNVIYKIVQTINAKLVATCPLDIFEWARASGRAVSVMSERRRSVLRPELQNAPKIEGLCGPMYDGEKNGVPVIRYEDAATFNYLSA